jgi:hypothetical protein
MYDVKFAHSLALSYILRSIVVKLAQILLHCHYAR